jgi:hypothetical protein
MRRRAVLTFGIARAARARISHRLPEINQIAL